LFYKQFIKKLKDSFFIIINNKNIIPQSDYLEECVNKVFEKYNNSKYEIITEKLIKQYDDNLIYIKKDYISDILDKFFELSIKSM